MGDGYGDGDGCGGGEGEDRGGGEGCGWGGRLRGVKLDIPLGGSLCSPTP